MLKKTAHFLDILDFECTESKGLQFVFPGERWAYSSCRNRVKWSQKIPVPFYFQDSSSNTFLRSLTLGWGDVDRVIYDTSSPNTQKSCMCPIFPWGSWLKDLGLIPGLQRPPGEEKGFPLQYSDLENSLDCTGSQKELDTTERLSLSFYI